MSRIGGSTVVDSGHSRVFGVANDLERRTKNSEKNVQN